MKNDVFYYLTVDDIQTVAEDQFDRKLTKPEIEMVKDEIAERICWFDTIAVVLQEKFGTKNEDDDNNNSDW